MEFRDMETDKTDLELIQEFQSGSSPAFDALYERYRRPLYGYVNRQMQGYTSHADACIVRKEHQKPDLIHFGIPG